MTWQDEADEQVFFEPILPKKGCKLEIVGAEATTWTPKAETGVTEPTKAVKVQLSITDTNVKCENADSRPRTQIEDQFNIERHPYMAKDGSGVAYLGRGKLYQLEEALGFEPKFVDENGNPMEPKITRTGNKIAPKGSKRMLNPEFVAAYFDSEGTPRFYAWLNKTVYADVDVEKSEQFGDKNKVSRYVRAPKV